MKPGIHPDYHPVVFRDSATGREFLTRSTLTSDTTTTWSADDPARTDALHRWVADPAWQHTTAAPPAALAGTAFRVRDPSVSA